VAERILAYKVISPGLAKGAGDNLRIFRSDFQPGDGAEKFFIELMGMRPPL
jgi:ribosomal protein L17